MYDITFCSKVECKHKDCFRNQCHVEDGKKLISISENKECEHWNE